MRPKQLGGSRVWTVGTGPTVVVVHGGPGFNHKYLVRPLEALAGHFRLVFYDQRSRGAVSPEALTAQLGRIIAAAGREDPPFVLAHSWGTYLAFACLTATNRPEVRGALLVSPVPLTLDWFRRAGARFDRSLPKPAPTDIKKLFPYYLARQNRGSTSIPVPQFNAAINGRVTDALERTSYDFRHASRLLPDPTSLVFGSQDQLSNASDFVGTTFRSGIEGARSRFAITTIPGAAHFAFAEQPERFKRAVLRAFR
jgi:proline iminopeptidase